jgi:hypothetical protein
MPLLQRNDRYALLTFENAHLADGIRFPIVLTDRIHILNALPVVPADHWKEWLGTLLWDSIEDRSNLFVLVREPNDQPGVLNHRGLRNEMMAFLHALALTGWPNFEGVHLLCGNVNPDGPDIRQHKEDPVDFKTGSDAQSLPLDEARLREVFNLSPEVLAINAAGWNRILRGYRALMDGLKMDFSEDRLHLFVRALDAVLKTRQGHGREDFRERSTATFLAAHADNDVAMNDIYFIRNSIEHLHDTELEPQRIADPAERKRVREHRLRQLEALAFAVYRRIVGDSALRAALDTDAKIDAFWDLPIATRAKAWNTLLDLGAVT